MTAPDRSSEPASDSLEFRCVDQIRRPPRRALVGDEVVEADDGDDHAEEILRHGASAAWPELDACRRREKLDARRRVAHPQHFSRRPQGLRRLFGRREAEVTQRREHAVRVDGGVVDPQVEVGRGPRVPMQGDRVAAEHEERNLMGRQRLQELAQVVRRRQLVQSRPPDRVEGRAVSRGPTCRARSRHRDPRRSSSRRGSAALGELVCLRATAGPAPPDSTAFCAAERRTAMGRDRSRVGRRCQLRAPEVHGRFTRDAFDFARTAPPARLRPPRPHCSSRGPQRRASCRKSPTLLQADHTENHRHAENHGHLLNASRAARHVQSRLSSLHRVCST